MVSLLPISQLKSADLVPPISGSLSSSSASEENGIFSTGAAAALAGAFFLTVFFAFVVVVAVWANACGMPTAKRALTSVRAVRYFFIVLRSIFNVAGWLKSVRLPALSLQTSRQLLRVTQHRRCGRAAECSSNSDNLRGRAACRRAGSDPIARPWL